MKQLCTSAGRYLGCSEPPSPYSDTESSPRGTHERLLKSHQIFNFNEGLLGHSFQGKMGGHCLEDQ